ncbi:MAG: ion transporter [Myxococcota bacterium]
MWAGFDRLHAAYHRPKRPEYQTVEWFNWCLTLLSVALVAIELIADLSPRARTFIFYADVVIVSFFSMDLLLRIGSYRPPSLDVFAGGVLYRTTEHLVGRLRLLFSPAVLVDLVTILSFVPALRALRALRFLRLGRGLRFFRYAQPIRGLLRSLEESWLLYGAAFGFLLTVVLVGGISLFLLERSVNPGLRRLPDGLWWAMVTVTTVGFGDIAPVTPLGRWVAVGVMVSGMFTLALVAGVVSVTLLGVVTRLKEEQFRMSNQIGHVVVLGYDAGALMLLQALRDEVASEREVVLMGQGPRPEELPSDFTWVPGDPTKETELDKVRLSCADTVLVIAPRQVAPQLADARTILIVFTLRSFLSGRGEVVRRAQPVYVVAEILDSENVQHAYTAGAQEVIETTRLGFAMMAHTVRAKGTGTVLSRVASAGALSVFIGLPERPFRTYRDGVDGLRARYGVTVIGLEEGGELLLGPRPQHRVHPGTAWVYLAPEQRLPPVGGPTSHGS